jgi:hypothetical protein
VQKDEPPGSQPDPFKEDKETSQPGEYEHKWGIEDDNGKPELTPVPDQPSKQ